ncbi:MAG: hypothetical protein ABI587_04100 [Gemmatimonadales bacterium]
MSSIEPIPDVLVPAVSAPLPQESLEPTPPPRRVHLVVVQSRALSTHESSGGGNSLRTRFWQPREHRWRENDFESLEHALRLFVDESGWVLLQDQALDEALAREWVFEAHRVDFSGATPEQILKDIGMTPASVEKLLEDVP